MTAKVLLAGILITCCITDIVARKIYNWASLGGALVGLTLNCYYFGLHGLALAVLGWFTGISILIIPYSLGGIGAGDAKLLGTVGAFLGAGFAWNSFLLAAILGGIYSAAVLLYQRKLLITLKSAFIGLGLLVIGGLKINILPCNTESSPPVTIPYGLFLGAGALTLLYLGG